MKQEYIIEDKKLDNNQISSIINCSRNNLVIASAGSGKTTTIIGKIKYLINNNINPSTILCLSFTNKSVKELQLRIKKELNIDFNIFTFHKLGISIINKSLKKYILTENSTIIIKIINQLLNNQEFLNNFNFFNNKFIYEYINIIEYAFFFSEYINLIKQENYSIDDLKEKSKNKKYQNFLKLFIPIFNEYQEYLKDNNLIDFNDMINIAYNLIKDDKVILPYKYIIIDEYQDLSISRYLLIKEIYDKNNTYLFCVGDDYQCIFSYAGSKIDLFINFKAYFGEFNLNIINKTYRFNQMLADISNKFIMKNNKQINKKINSINKNNIKSLKIIDVNDLSLELMSLKFHSKVFFLGRYKYDLKIIEDNNLFNIDKQSETIIYFLKRIDLNIRFLTIHQSKGLEADYVFIINNKKGKNGFPSERKDDYIKNIILKNKKHLEEERRLFYVALTRVKIKTILLVENNNESIFIKEIRRYLKKY